MSSTFSEGWLLSVSTDFGDESEGWLLSEASVEG